MSKSKNYKKANEIRSDFLSYFKKQGHTVVESSSLIPQNDPTLLFASAGMVQFKDCFLGTDVRSYKRATSAQKCLRAGGKHNDLERVGFTARHHTFFEMMGNFSFGDYFKKDAIHFAWEFVTKILNIPKESLYVTVFETDDEAADIWHKQESVPLNRIYRFGEKDNFWSAGDVGPCGPCSEIFVDRGEKYSKGPQDVMGGDGDRFMEIWNLVFMQYHRDETGKLNPLKKPSIDTGAGLERIASVLQDVESNYDIDLFQNIIASIKNLASFKPSGDAKKDEALKCSMQVIADHCRATNFLMADGILPSNEGRGYVLRRIMRRAIRHGRNLGFREPFFWQLTDVLIKEMGSTYGELKDKKEFLIENIRQEEERFLVTLENGLKIFEETTEKMTSKKTIPGDVAFKLYDTYGFPLDLTEVIAQERGFKVDHGGFEKSMEEQRNRSRESWKGSGEQAIESVFKELKSKNFKSTFLGYQDTKSSGKILALIENGILKTQVNGLKFQMIVDQTPFYAESGGQLGDTGFLKTPRGDQALVTDVQKHDGDFVVLTCEGGQGQFKVGDTVIQEVDGRKRKLTAKNHTATHLLHHALRKFLGTHVKQAGSLVTPDFLRFDFSHGKALTSKELQQIEDDINEKILDQGDVFTEELDKDQAIAKGAIAFFGDKYGDKVRVISVGDYSVELCGGTHVRNSGDIQSFRILNENGIAAGVRRITAVTGPKVVELLRNRDQEIFKLMDFLKASNSDEILPKVEKLALAEKEARKKLETVLLHDLEKTAEQWIQNAVNLKGVQFVPAVLEKTQGLTDVMGGLRDLTESLRSKFKNTVLAIGAVDLEKDQAVLIVGVTKDISNKISAGTLIKEACLLFDGRGGGKPELAQAGGKKKDQFDNIFKLLKKIIEER